MRKAKVIGAMLLAATLGTPAFADEFSGFRLGIGLGQQTFESDVSYLGYFDNVDTTRASYSVFGGWALNKYFAVEVGFRDGSDFNQILASDGLFPTRSMKIHDDMKGGEASVTGAWWVTPKFGLYGRAGVYAWKSDIIFSEDPDTSFPIDCGCATPPPNPVNRTSFSDDGIEPFLGFGLQTVLDGALVRIEYQMMELDDFGSASTDPSMLDTTVNSLQFSIVWNLH
jgi:hypothetical protein